jgi:thioredoxin 1
MATVELTTENFESVVADHELVIVDFWAAWCAPCRAFAPTYEAASEQHPDIVFGKVDTEAQQELAAAFGIRSIPTLMVFREKIILYAEAGALPPALLEEVIAKTRSVDMAEVHREIAAGSAGPER